MPRHYKVLGFLLVTIIGVYGCAKGPGSSPAGEGNATTTAKAQKLEEDYRAAVAARDHLRQKLGAVEEQQARLQRELEQVQATAATEREALKNEVKARTSERDAVNSQYEGFRKSLRELIGNADSSMNALNLPSTKPAADQGARK